MIPPVTADATSLASGGQTRVTENDERTLTEYLLQEVRAGLDGSSNEYVVDFAPSRFFFAGVLQPVWDQKPSAGTGSSAIGIDFRIRVDDENVPAVIRLAARWAHYYAVF